MSDAINGPDSRLLWERGTQFLGQQTAAQCHEVTNVFNIINELVGLMGDFLWAAQNRGKPLDADRLAKLTDKIAAQVQRGNTIVRAVNQFGHTADMPRAVFDLRGALEAIVFIAQRPANLSKTTLETDFPEATLALETSPLGFQQAVFTAFQILLAAVADKRRIVVGYRIADDGARLEVTSDDPVTADSENAEQAEFLRLLVSALGGRVEHLAEPPDPHRITMYFPKRTDEE